MRIMPLLCSIIPYLLHPQTRENIIQEAD